MIYSPTYWEFIEVIKGLFDFDGDSTRCKMCKEDAGFNVEEQILNWWYGLRFDSWVEKTWIKGTFHKKKTYLYQTYYLLDHHKATHPFEYDIIMRTLPYG